MTKAIVNLTQHTATAEQIAAGVTDLPEAQRKQLGELLTFESLPSRVEVAARAAAIAAMVPETQVPHEARFALVGGAPWLMAPLERALDEAGVIPRYAFSQRESVEEKQPDGSVRKVNVFRHKGFVEAV